MMATLDLTLLHRCAGILLFVVSYVGGSHTAQAQLKLSDQGNVSVGTLDESSTEKMSVECADNAECGTQVLEARYTGTAVGINVAGVRGHAVSGPEMGYGGYFTGGKHGVYGVRNGDGDGAGGAFIGGRYGGWFNGITYGVYGRVSTEQVIGESTSLDPQLEVGILPDEGVFDDVTEPTGYGGYFVGGDYGGYLKGATYGVYGRGEDASATGVFGEGLGNDGIGARGIGDAYGLYGESADGTGVGVYGESGDISTGAGTGTGGDFRGAYRGAYSRAGGSGATGPTYGAWGQASNGGYNAYGTRGYATVNGSGNTYGLYSEAGTIDPNSGGSNAYGVFASGRNGTKTSYGIYATASGTGDVWAGYFNGNVVVAGTIRETSDERLKRNIQDLPTDEALNRVRQLQPRTFRYRPAAVENLNLSTGLQFGFIAQEVEALIPQLVEEQTHTIFRGGGVDPETGDPIEPQEQELTFKTLNYVSLIPVLTAAIQQQQAQIDLLIQTLIANGLDVPPELTAGL